MDSFVNSILSPWWWVTVVLGTIVLNVISNRIDRWVPRLWGSLDAAWQEKSTRRREARAARVLRMQESNDFLLLGYLQSTQQRFWAIVYFLIAVLFIGLSQHPTRELGVRELDVLVKFAAFGDVVIWGIALVLGCNKLFRAMITDSEIQTALQKRTDRRTPNPRAN
jgi:hypothetical protein